MQMKDLITPISDMSEEQLRERLREIRHNRTKVKPATANRTKREAKVGGQGRITKATDLFGGLSPEDKARLIEQLKGG